MNSKKIIALVLAAVLALFFAGCSPMETNVENLIVPPKLEGEMRPVQEALEASVGRDITLRYPVSGEYHSAIVMKDLNGDGTDEAVAFYSTTADSTVMMHINVIAKGQEGWQRGAFMQL